MTTAADDDLRRCVRDLVALSAIPAIWSGQKATDIAESLADVLLTTLRADVAYVRLLVPGGEAIEASRGREMGLRTRPPTLAGTLEPFLSERLGAVVEVPTHGGTMRLITLPIGHGAKAGLAAVGALRPDFPTQLDRILLNVALNQAALREGDRLKDELLTRERVAREQAEAAEARLREESRINETLYRLGAAFAGELDHEKLVQRITDEATALSGAEFGAYFYNVKSPDGESYVLYTLAGVSRDHFAKFPLPRNTAIFEPTFRGLGVVRLDDVQRDPRYGKNAPYHGMPEGHLPVRSYLAVPIMSRSGEVLGGLFFGHSQPGRFTIQHERLVGGIASQASVALDNARLYREQGESEERAQESLRLLEESERRKDEFLAMLGHELRNPLAPILMSLELMRARGTAGERERGIIERQIRHMTRLVDDLLDISRISRGKIQLRREPTDLASVVARAVETTRPLIVQRQHELTVSVPPGLTVDVDPLRIAQVVANLLNNAAKYTEPRGRIRVTATVADAQVNLMIQDTGQGIAPELLPRIFEIFVQGDRTLDRTQGGLGIGLALARTLVSMHGGAISAHSEGPGRGTTLTVRLPVAAQAVASAAAPTEAAPSARQAAGSVQRKRVLVAEDQVDGAELLAEVLRLAGHEVHVVHDGSEALVALAEMAPDVALLDIGLPRLDGLEVARRVRASTATRRVRLIAITGYGQSADRARSLEAGFDDHLVKPIDLDMLCSLVAGEQQETSRPSASPA